MYGGNSCNGTNQETDKCNERKCPGKIFAMENRDIISLVLIQTAERLKGIWV